tara:strand:+ start:431 stop:712 length:282 start_codon:yes stop_codon:yes gene_type:complete
MKTITSFLSNPLNLTLLQCLLYFLLGVIMKDTGLNWNQLTVVFFILLAINFITHIKGVSKGMVMNQLMQDDLNEYGKIIKRIKKESKKFKDLD